MLKKKMTLRISLVAIMVIMILATSVSILSVAAGFSQNSINWVVEKLTREVTIHIIDKLENTDLERNLPVVREFIRDIDVSPNSKILLLDDEQTIIASSERSDDTLLPQRFDAVKTNITKVDDLLIAKSYKYFNKNVKRKERKIFKRKFDHFAFWQGGKKYIAIYEPFQAAAGKTWVLGIVFPHSDFFKSLTRNNIILYSIAALFVIVSLIIGLRISKRITDPLTKLALETEKIREFELTPTGHISSFLLEVENMSSAIDNMRSGLRSFKKYVPADLVKELIHLNKEATLGGEKRSMTVFFSDIAGFTSISEKLPAEELVAMLGEYLGEMTHIILSHKGTVDKYIGDCIMAFWGAPAVLNNHAEQACRAALMYQARLSEIGKKWQAMGKPDFRSRIGINTGAIIVGNMGYEERMNYTVIGDSVNLASRLESINKYYGTKIMIGEETYNDIKNYFETRLIDVVAVKGKEKGTHIYELIGMKDQIDQTNDKLRTHYHEGLQLYLNRKFEDALKAFQAAYSINRDEASNIFIKRCEEFMVNPPDRNWDGVYVAKSK